MHDSGKAAFPLASLVFIGLAWVVPFLQPYHRYPFVSFYSEWLALALGLAAALLLVRRESWREATLPLVALAPLGLILLLGLQVALGRVPYPEQTLTAALYLIWAALLMVLAQVLRRALGLATVAEVLAWFLLAGGALTALIGLTQHYQASTALDFMIMRKEAAVFGNVGQPNHYATQVTLALASAAYLYGRGRLSGAPAAGCVALLTFAMTLSGSRSPWIYLGMLAVLSWLVHRRQGDERSRRLFRFALWLLPGFAAAQWLSILSFLQPAEGVVVTSLQRLFESAGGIAARLQLAHEAWRMFLESPLLGAGYGQFAWHHFLWTPPGHVAAPGVYNHAHNIVLQLMAETGLAGACLVMSVALAWLAGWWKAPHDLEWWWVLALSAVLAVHSLLEFPLWYSYFLGIASILLGLGATHVLPLRIPPLGRAVAALALALGWLHVVTIVAPYRTFERLMFETRRDESRMEEREFGAAVMEIHAEPLLKPYVELALSFGIVVSDTELRDKLDLNGRVMRFAPIDLVVYRHALLQEMSGEHDAALRQLELAARAYPRELENFAAGLEALERRHPGRFVRLLELTREKTAQSRARASTGRIR